MVISSLNDKTEVEAVLAESAGTISFIFVKLSECIKKNRVKDWINWVFVEQEEERSLLSQSAWGVSPLRMKILQNEKVLEEMLNAYEKTTSFKMEER